MPRRLPAMALIGALALLTACSGNPIKRGARDKEFPPPVDRAIASATLLTSYLELLQRLVQSAPAQQAEILMTTQREFDLAPTPSHQLRLALVLAALAMPQRTCPKLKNCYAICWPRPRLCCRWSAPSPSSSCKKWIRN